MNNPPCQLAGAGGGAQPPPAAAGGALAWLVEVCARSRNLRLSRRSAAVMIRRRWPRIIQFRIICLLYVHHDAFLCVEQYL